MAVTNATTLASAIAEKFQKKLVPGMKGKGVLERFAAKAKVKKSEGNKLRMNRVLRLARQTSYNLTEESTTNTAKALTSNYIYETVGVMGDSLENTTLTKLTSILEDNTYRDAVSDQVVRSKEYVISKKISTYNLRHRVDNDSTYEVSGTPDSGSTTTLVDAVRTEADDAWGTDTSNFGIVAFTNPEGTLYDTATHITNFTASSDTMTLATVNHAVDTTSTYHATIGTALAATDTLTLTALTRVAGMHRKLKTEKFKGGMLYGVIDSEQEADLYGDTLYQGIMQYSKPQLLNNYRIIPVLDMQLIVNDDSMYKEDVDGSENASTGVVHIANIFGKNAFQTIKWGEGGDAFGVKINIITEPDSNNRWGLKWWINWHCFSAVGVLRATSIIGLMTGATALPVTI